MFFFQRNWSPLLFISHSSLSLLSKLTYTLKFSGKKDSFFVVVVVFLSKHQRGHVIYRPNERGAWNAKFHLSYNMTSDSLSQRLCGREDVRWHHNQIFLAMELRSPAKNVWLVDARPRDIAKFKMAAIPPSFVYSSGKKVNCGLIWVANTYQIFLV